MKLHPDSPQASYHVSAHGDGFVDVNQQRYRSGICVVADTAPQPWGAGGFDALTEQDFDALAGLGAEVVLIGTGVRQRFPRPALLRRLITAGIGYEVMSTAAACRTYNVLVGEGRRAAAALVIEAAPDHL